MNKKNISNQLFYKKVPCKISLFFLVEKLKAFKSCNEEISKK